MPSDDRRMISSVLSNAEELEINNAYANIGLIAGKVWAYDQEDPYRKLNQSLWVKNCKLWEANNGTTRTVRDVIPTSRLAQYGDYEYNEEREKMYKSVESGGASWVDRRDIHDLRFGKSGVVSSTEPWMLKKVEEYFLGLTSTNDNRYSPHSMTEQSSYTDSNGTEANKSSQREDSMPIPYTVGDNDESQLQSRVSSNKVKDLWNCRTTLTSRGQRTKINEEKMTNFRHCGDKRLIEPRKFYPQSSMRNDQSLIIRGQTMYSETSIRKPVFPILSAEVPEFFPKAPPPPPPPTHGLENRPAPMPFFPSSTERSYQDELFPYNRGHLSHSITIPQNASGIPIAVAHPTVNTLIRAPHQWIQRLGPPIQIQVPGICSAIHPPIYSTIQPIFPAAIIHRPINLHDKILTAGTSTASAGPAPIPVYQRPAELYQDASQRRMKNHQGVDFSNLILLTKNAMKARRNQSKNPQQASSFILESRQPNLKSETDVLQWLDKGYPKRAREFVSVNSLVSELTNFQSKCDASSTIKTTSCTDIGTNPVATESDNLDIVNDDLDLPVAKKRLYRDVLANATTSTEIILETVLDKRYDELEQQAMEQYRTSEECLALRYQELERQALEQYKNGSSSSEQSIRSIKSSTVCGKKDQDEDERDEVIRFEDNGLRRGSGFEKRCGRGSQDNIFSERVKGSPVERQVVILRPDNRFTSVSSVREGSVESCAIASRGTTVITKSLTALNHVTIAGITGNKIKGASGDTKEDGVKSSLKERHLILVSTPLKRSIPISSDTAISVGGVGSSLCYRKPIADEGISSGGAGDEKLTVLDSPAGAAQVWLSSLWN